MEEGVEVTHGYQRGAGSHTRYNLFIQTGGRNTSTAGNVSSIMIDIRSNVLRLLLQSKCIPMFGRRMEEKRGMSLMQFSGKEKKFLSLLSCLLPLDTDLLLFR